METIPELTFWDRVVALLSKIGAYLSDGRTYAAILALVLALKMWTGVEIEIDEETLSSSLQVFSDLMITLGKAVTVLVTLVSYLKVTTERPTRGLAPWLDAIQNKKIVAAALAPKG